MEDHRSWKFILFGTKDPKNSKIKKNGAINHDKKNYKNFIILIVKCEQMQL
jgi:hypothetical protein